MTYLFTVRVWRELGRGASIARQGAARAQRSAVFSRMGGLIAFVREQVGDMIKINSRKHHG
jgi:hypothetical protein